MIPEYMQVTRCPWCDAEIDPPAYASTGTDKDWTHECPVRGKPVTVMPWKPGDELFT